MSGADLLETPLGALRVGAVPSFLHLTESAHAHAREHSLEVQLPFLREVLGPVEVIPLLVGEAEPAEVAAVIDALWGGEETLVAISSDLSHYLEYDEACATDRVSANRIRALSPLLSHEDACGALPIDGLLLAARRRSMRVEELDLRNSGDTGGSMDRVVGYGAFAFHEEDR